MQHSWWQSSWQEIRAGWAVLLASVIGVAMGAAALPYYTAGVFVKPMQDEFGWTRSQIFDAQFAWTISVVVCAPFVGALIDRFGVRVLAAFGIASLAVTFSALSLMQGDYVTYIIIQALGAAAGVASTPLAFSRAVNGQFDKVRGLALGVTLAGTGLTAAFAPGIVTAIVAADGWRFGYRALAITALCAAPIVFFLLSLGRRNRPAAVATTLPTAHISLGEAFSNPIFLRLLLVFLILAIGIGGWVPTMIPMLTDAGMDRSQAASIQGLLGVAVVLGRVVIGVLVDHFFAPRVAAVALTITALGMIALAVYGPAVAVPAALAIGFAMGAEVDLIGYLTARYFGLNVYGRLYGFLYSSFVLGVGLSPMLISRLQESSGSYDTALWASAAMVGIAVLMFVTSPRFPQQADVTVGRANGAAEPARS